MTRVSKFGFGYLNSLQRYELRLLWDLFGLLPDTIHFLRFCFCFAVITLFYHSQADLFHFFSLSVRNLAPFVPT